jgi:hypothetical protein
MLNRGSRCASRAFLACSQIHFEREGKLMSVQSLHWNTFRTVLVLVTVGLTLAHLVGCSGARTRYYFAAADLDDSGADDQPSSNATLTFYRVTFNAASFGVKASLQQGFYDAGALHQLFGEVKNPNAKEKKDDATDKAKDAANAKGKAKAKTMPKASDSASAPNSADDANAAVPAVNSASVSSGSYTLEFDPATRTWHVMDEPQRFTIIYGANADAMASQVQAFADNDELGQQIGKILKSSIAKKNKKPAAQDADAKTLKADQASANAVAKKLDAASKSIKDDAMPNAVRASLVQAAQDLLDSLGNKETLDKSNFDAAMTHAGELLDTLTKKTK